MLGTRGTSFMCGLLKSVPSLIGVTGYQVQTAHRNIRLRESRRLSAHDSPFQTCARQTLRYYTRLQATIAFVTRDSDYAAANNPPVRRLMSTPSTRLIKMHFHTHRRTRARFMRCAFGRTPSVQSRTQLGYRSLSLVNKHRRD